MYIRLMVNNAKVDVRLPADLRSALERERRRMSKAFGMDVKMSAVIRSILRRELLTKGRRPASSERAA